MDDLLKLVKNYLRLDDDITEDDGQITGLITAAKDYIQNMTGKQYDDSPVMVLAVELLVSHWYTDRSPVSKNTTRDYGHSLSAILTHIETSDAYKPVKEP